MNRRIAATATAVVAVTALGAATSPAQSASAEPKVTYSAAPADKTQQAGPTGLAAAKPYRKINGSFAQPNPGRPPIYVQGFVERWPNGKVVIQKSRCRSGCRWRWHTTTRTNDNRFFKAQVYAPTRGRLHWRAVVAPAGAYSWGFEYFGSTYRN